MAQRVLSKMKLSNIDFKKFSKQIILKNIGLAGQKKIIDSKVLIIGMGGLGCPLSIYLANAGVGNIGIVDDDKIEITNLNRQILFTLEDVGKYKVNIAKKKIKQINNKIKLHIFKKKVNKDNIENIIKKFDIICDGTDNFDTRYLINDFCLKKKKILISAAVSKFNGHLFNFNFKKKVPCYRCFMPEKPVIKRNCENEGIMSPVAGVLGTLQANEVLKTILNLKFDLFKKILIFDGLKMEFRKVNLKKNSKCKNRC